MVLCKCIKQGLAYIFRLVKGMSVRLETQVTDRISLLLKGAAYGDGGNGHQQVHDIIPGALHIQFQSRGPLQLALQVLRRVTGNQLPLGNDHDVVTDSTDLREDMGTEYDRMFPAQITDHIPNLDNLFGIQSDGGLIQDDYIRFAEDGLGHTHPLAVALGKVAYQAAFHVLDFYQFHDLVNGSLKAVFWKLF